MHLLAVVANRWSRAGGPLPAGWRASEAAQLVAALLTTAAALLALRLLCTTPRASAAFLVRAELAAHTALVLFGAFAYGEACEGSAAACAASFFWSHHLAAIPKWIASVLPADVVFAPEAVRNAAYALVAGAAAACDGSLSPSVAAALACRALASQAATLLAVEACTARGAADAAGVLQLETCPALLQGTRSTWIDVVRDLLARAAFDEPLLQPEEVSGICLGVACGACSCLPLDRGFMKGSRGYAFV